MLPNLVDYCQKQSERLQEACVKAVEDPEDWIQDLMETDEILGEGEEDEWTI